MLGAGDFHNTYVQTDMTPMQSFGPMLAGGGGGGGEAVGGGLLSTSQL